jgi:hypothetical protein
MSEDRILSMDSIVSAVSNQLSADLDGETVILHLESGTYYGLSDVGVRIWNLIQEPRPVSDVRDVLLKEYDVEPVQCGRDVLALLGDLEAHKLIEIRSQPESNEHPIVISSMPS